MVKAVKIFGRTVLILIALVLLLAIAIQTSTVQNWLVGMATKKLSKELNTTVAIKKVSFSFFNKANIEGILVKDKRKDTLLYADVLRVRITDWFFLKDKIELKYIGLEQAVVKLHRTDSVWNYAFIVDYFSPTTPDTSSKKAIALDIKKVDFKNIVFTQADLWRGETITGKLVGLLIDAEKVDFNNGNIALNSVQIEQPYFKIEQSKSLRPDYLKPKPVLNVKDTGLRFNPGVNLTAKSIMLNNGSIISLADGLKATTGFDGEHLYITKLSGSFNNVIFKRDTLIAAMDIACKERSGFELRRLKSKLKVTPEIIELAKLELITNNSKIGDYYAMRFKHFNDDFANYEEKVVMDARFKNTTISSDDVAYFAADLKDWNKRVNVAGNFIGTVANFSITNFFINAGTTTNVAGNLSMKGLPNIDKTFIKLTNGTVKTDYKDLITVVPALKKVNTPKLSALGNMLYRGTFEGTVNNFLANGVLSSNIGAVDANIAMNLPKKGEPTYKGTIYTNRFNLGKLLNTNTIGLVDFDGNITGYSFNENKVKAKLEGFFSNIELNGYNYTNVTTNASIENKFIKGELKVTDPNIDFTSGLEIDFSREKPYINILGDIVKSNFKALQLTKDDIQLSGFFDLNFTGKNIDEFTGTAKILNTNLTNGNEKLSFDSLVLTANQTDTFKTISLASNEFTANLTGKNYTLLDLPNAIQTFLNRYYPTYFAAPTTVPKNQDFSLSVYTKDFDKYARLLDKKLGGLDYASIVGKVNTNEKLFNLEASIPTLQYDKININDAYFMGIGNGDSLIVEGEITTIQLADSLYFPNTTFNILSSNDYSKVSIEAKANSTLNEAKLNTEVYALADGVRIHFLPSSFNVNDKKWSLEKEGEVVIRKYFVGAENVKFTSGLQEIKIETELAEEGTTANNLIVNLKNVVIGDITSLFLKNPSLEGVANGKVVLHDFFGKFNADANIKATEFRVNNDSIGNLNLAANFNNSTGKLTYTANALNTTYNFKSEGYYNTKTDSLATADIMYFKNELNNTSIVAIQPFLEGLFDDVKGFATGNIVVSGSPEAPNIKGDVLLKKAGLKVNFTQVYYGIDSAFIQFQPDGINFNQFTIKDKFSNTGKVVGKLYEKNFANMKFDFDMSTNKLLLIDTKAKDNKQFYGNAIGKASLSFKGPEQAAKMELIAEANDSSHIFIPLSNSKESGDADFIVFKKYGTEIEPDQKKQGFDLTVDLDITANNKVAIDVILDDLTGDVIKARGNGRMQIVAGTTAPLTMKGRYSIERGSYDFNFQAFIRKPFDLLPGYDNYIEWTGDPFKAELHIDAVYTAERVSVNDLLSSQRATVNPTTSSYRGQVFVIASLRQFLTKPDISFKLDFPQASPLKTDAIFAEFINRIERDPSEMLSQATSLIVFGTFAPYGQGLLAASGGSGSNLNNFGVNTLSQLITKQLNKAVSNLLFKITGDKSLKFDIGTNVYSSSSIMDASSGVTATSNRLDRTNINFKVGKSFLDEKIIITLGSEFDFGVGNTTNLTNGNFQWLPDLNAEFVLSKDRRLRAIVFTKNSLDISGGTLGRRNRQGVGITYKKDFDKFWGKKEEETVVPKPVAAIPANTSGGGN